MQKLISAVFRECQNPACSFRFPDIGSNFSEIQCPKCGDIAKTLYSIDLEYDHRQKLSCKPVINIICVFDNIRSVYNIGAMFRTMQGFRLGTTILCGITPKPTHKHFSKTSLAAEENIEWSYSNNAVNTCKSYKSMGYQIISLESCARSETIGTITSQSLSDDILLFVGNEITGIDKDILQISDLILSIPITGKNKSYNVTTAHGIALYQLLNC